MNIQTTEQISYDWGQESKSTEVIEHINLNCTPATHNPSYYDLTLPAITSKWFQEWAEFLRCYLYYQPTQNESENQYLSTQPGLTDHTQWTSRYPMLGQHKILHAHWLKTTEGTSWPIKYLKPTHTLGDNNQRQAHDDVNQMSSPWQQHQPTEHRTEWNRWMRTLMKDGTTTQQGQQTQTATEDKKGPEGTGLT